MEEILSNRTQKTPKKIQKGQNGLILENIEIGPFSGLTSTTDQRKKSVKFRVSTRRRNQSTPHLTATNFGLNHQTPKNPEIDLKTHYRGESYDYSTTKASQTSQKRQKTGSFVHIKSDRPKRKKPEKVVDILWQDIRGSNAAKNNLQRSAMTIILPNSVKSAKKVSSFSSASPGPTLDYLRSRATMQASKGSKRVASRYLIDSASTRVPSKMRSKISRLRPIPAQNRLKIPPSASQNPAMAATPRIKTTPRAHPRRQSVLINQAIASARAPQDISISSKPWTQYLESLNLAAKHQKGQKSPNHPNQKNRNFSSKIAQKTSPKQVYRTQSKNLGDEFELDVEKVTPGQTIAKSVFRAVKEYKQKEMRKKGFTAVLKHRRRKKELWRTRHPDYKKLEKDIFKKTKILNQEDEAYWNGIDRRYKRSLGETTFREINQDCSRVQNRTFWSHIDFLDHLFGKRNKYIPKTKEFFKKEGFDNFIKQYKFLLESTKVKELKSFDRFLKQKTEMKNFQHEMKNYNDLLSYMNKFSGLKDIYEEDVMEYCRDFDVRELEPHLSAIIPNKRYNEERAEMSLKYN